MRNHAVIIPQFWTGETGRFLRQWPDAQRLALYLMTCPSANMIGLYYIPIPTICHELGITDAEAREALARVYEGGFASYDEGSETVFVYEMARYQIGDEIKRGDNRIKGIEKQLESYRKSKYFNEFLKRYGSRFRLQISDCSRSPFEGASSKPLRSQEQEQEQEQDLQESTIVDSSVPPVPAAPSSEFRFPVQHSDFWDLPQRKLDEYLATYSDRLDVAIELRKARQWLVDNKDRRKTKLGMPKFLTSWLNRALDSSSRSSSTEPLPKFFNA